MEANINTNTLESVVNGAIDREACLKHWCVAQVRMKCEKIVARQISLMGYETFIPIQEEVRQWSDRKKRIERILIPLVVFFKCNESGAKEVEKLSSVFSLMRAPGQKDVAIIPDEQMEQFMFLIGNCSERISIEPQIFSKGDHVRVIRGTLKGIEGYVKNDKNESSRLFIILDFFGCASVNIQQTDIEKIL